MPEGKRFPLLYYISLALMALMLVSAVYFFYRSSSGYCPSVMQDVVVKDEVQRLWRSGRVSALLTADPAEAQNLALVKKGLTSHFSKDFEVLILDPGKRCVEQLSEYLYRVPAGNQLIVIPSVCAAELTDGSVAKTIPLLLAEEQAAGVVVFTRLPPDGKALSVLGCAWPEDWQ
ncbi:MAG TPA: hypothetical protein ENG92_01115 [Thiolapillus brandeum]|uniref:Uncharacterized protein n=1 Tax=Thiolapillus brandeum TaxID=1076588 RepID=A0A831KC04_9GAMM|nr:hypothetical protein [Thiolapillus brandeum]